MSENNIQTAFLIAIDKEGAANLILDVQGLEMERTANMKDARRAILEVAADIAAQAAAQYTVSQLKQAMQPEPTAGERVAEALAKREDGEE